MITGAGGRVGREVVAYGRAKGWRQRLLQRHRDSSLAVGPSEEAIAGSVTNASLIAELVLDVDAVIHLAALMPPADDRRLFAVNVKGTFTIAEALTRLNPRARLVFVSTDAVYGTGWGDVHYRVPIEEEAPPAPANFYGATKVLAERVLAHYHRLCGLNCITLRLAWVFGPGEVLTLFSPLTWQDVLSTSDLSTLEHLSAVPVLRQADGQSFGDHIVSSADAASAVVLATEHQGDAGEVFNIAGPSPFTYERLAPLVAEKLGRDTVDVRSSKLHTYELSIDKARRRLGYEPRMSVDAMLDQAFAASTTARR